MKSNIVRLLLLALVIVWPGFSGNADAEERSAIAIKKNDKNGDGRVSRREWRKPKKIFNEIDVNGDGFLTREEF